VLDERQRGSETTEAVSSSPESHPLEDAVIAAFRPSGTTLESARAARDAAPDDPLARALDLGHLAHGLSPLRSSSAHMEEALRWLRERPTDLEHVLTGFSRYTHAPLEQYEVLRGAFDEALAAHGGDASVLRAVGRLVQHHEPKRAFALLESAHELDPTDMCAAWWIGHQHALANELLRAGERAAVLTYLQAVGQLWTMDRGLLAHWRTRIEAGETPELSRSARN